MRPIDFFNQPVDDDLPVIVGRDWIPPAPSFNVGLVRELRAGPIAGSPDIEVAVALTRLVHDELEAFGTSGGENLNDREMREALLGLQAVVQRVGLTPPKLPFSDFKTFRSHWLREGASGSYQARRDILDLLFEDLHQRLADLETQGLSAVLAEGVSPRGRTGWARVDENIAELRRHFASARSGLDYRNVGNDAMSVLEELSRVAYDAERHLRPGETEPAVDKTKQRLTRYVEDALPGGENEALRALVRASIEFAQTVKHRSSPTRRDAGLAADAVIILANLLRRLAEDTP